MPAFLRRRSAAGPLRAWAATHARQRVRGRHTWGGAFHRVFLGDRAWGAMRGQDPTPDRLLRFTDGVARDVCDSPPFSPRCAATRAWRIILGLCGSPPGQIAAQRGHGKIDTSGGRGIGGRGTRAVRDGPCKTGRPCSAVRADQGAGAGGGNGQGWQLQGWEETRRHLHRARPPSWASAGAVNVGIGVPLT